MTKEFVMTPAIEWLESDKNEYQRYPLSRRMELIEFKDDTCHCDEGDYCKRDFEFNGMTITELEVEEGAEACSYEYAKTLHSQASPQLKYLGVAQ